MHSVSRLMSLSICLASVASISAVTADVDGDGVADEFTVTREAAKVAKESDWRLANPWKTSKKAPAGFVC
jgi:hypothetical protein